MCSIDKLLIKGIRSFSPDNQNVVEFYKPLTLIVGQNGAGKTTIIECLKQVCTGELPPNTRSGQSFIHDPKVAGETEVKAQIKLRFRTAQNAPIVIVRSFQLTQKAKALQFKALDQVLQTFNQETGAKEAISYRCADIDRLVPQLMGVSKAVLENVIFVHQEDSNWPLAEGLVLKKKFDDIFAATKYTKALETLRKLRTEKTQEVKQFTLQLAHLKTHKDTATRLRTDIEGGNTRAQELEADIADCNEKILEHQARVDEANEKLSQVASLANKLENMKVKQQTLHKQNGDAYARYVSRWGEDDADESAAQLQSILDNLDPKLQEIQTELRQTQRAGDSKRAQLQGLEGQYMQDSQRRDRLQAQTDQHARLLQDRDRAIRTTGADLGIPIPGGQGPMSDEAVRAFNMAFEGRTQELQTQMQDARRANCRTDEQMSARLDGVTGEMAGLREAIRQKQQQLDTFEARKASLEQQMAACQVRRVAVTQAEERAAETRAAMERAEATLQDANPAAELARLDGELQAVSNAIRRLREERNRLSIASEAATRVKLKRQEVESKAEELEDLMRSHRGRLLSVLGVRELPQDAQQLRIEVDQAVESRKAALGAARKDAHEAGRAAASDRSTMQSAEQALAALESEHEAARAQLTTGLKKAASTQTQQETQMTQEAELPERLEYKLADLEAATESVQKGESLKQMHGVYKQYAAEHRACYTCDRAFEDDSAVETFIAKQDEAIAQLPVRLDGLRKQQVAIRAQLTALRKLEPMHARLQTLAHQLLPTATTKAEEAKEKCQRSEQRAKELQGAIPGAERSLQEAQTAAHDAAWPAAALAREIDALQQDIDTETRQQAAAGAGRTVVDVDRDLELQEAKRAAAQTQRDQLLARVNAARDEVTEMTKAYHDAREHLSTTKTMAERKSALSRQLQELENSNRAAVDGIQHLSEQQPALDAKHQTLLREREQKRGEGAAREAQIDEQRQALRQKGALLRSLQDQVEAFAQQDIAGQLARLAETLAGSEQLQRTTRDHLKELESKMADLQDRIRSHEETRAQVMELLALRRSKEEEEAVFHEMEQLQSRAEQVGDVAALQRMFADHRQQVVDARSRRDEMRGSLATVKEGVARAQRDLGAPQFRDIDAKYRTQNIQLTTTKMATSDLEKYHKALEKALLAFHTNKMTDINKTIKELWQKTYRNQDIDYIQVKADSEGAGARSYNYRVVMYAGGAELDMRGRCSAGQKVLACLIIRLALAETFCLNCGILALDEPTTNLDAANAASLAAGLRSIIDARRVQQNFQLVIITHDENFASLIGTREHADHMWRITKNENQHSHITQEDIAG